jgi:hypothetical protein
LSRNGTGGALTRFHVLPASVVTMTMALQPATAGGGGRSGPNRHPTLPSTNPVDGDTKLAAHGSKAVGTACVDAAGAVEAKTPPTTHASPTPATRRNQRGALACPADPAAIFRRIGQSPIAHEAYPGASPPREEEQREGGRQRRLLKRGFRDLRTLTASPMGNPMTAELGPGEIG